MVKLNWGVGIAGVYILFAAATMGFVAFAMGRPVELVSDDYYARSLRHDERLRAEARARDLGAAFSCALAEDGRTAVVSVPLDQAPIAQGTITVYRPSDASADLLLPLALDAEGRQQVRLARPGRWVLKIQWSTHDRSYYHEQTMVAK